MSISKPLLSSPIPKLTFIAGYNSGEIPVLGMGTATFPAPDPKDLKEIIIQAIKLGYRHFDTAPRYQTEQPLGEAIEEAVAIGLVKSRTEFFITSKLWCSDAHQELVLPAIKRSLQNLKLDYLDLYLIHWPISATPGISRFPTKEDLLPMDYNSVWSEMELCQVNGLTKSIGVSNFSCRKLQVILSEAKIPPAVNQVEMSPIWRQEKLMEFSKENGIVVTAYSVLGSKGTPWGADRVMESRVLDEIAKAKGKTIAQVCMRWVYEQGVSMVVKSFNIERLKQNLEIFDWCLTEEETRKISQISQTRTVDGAAFVFQNGPIKTVHQMWDGEI